MCREVSTQYARSYRAAHPDEPDGRYPQRLTYVVCKEGMARQNAPNANIVGSRYDMCRAITTAMFSEEG